jgi:hypothetical protein
MKYLASLALIVLRNQNHTLLTLNYLSLLEYFVVLYHDGLYLFFLDTAMNGIVDTHILYILILALNSFYCSYGLLSINYINSNPLLHLNIISHFRM